MPDCVAERTEFELPVPSTPYRRTRLLRGPSPGGLDDPAPSFEPRSPRQCGEEGGRSLIGWVRKQAAGRSLKILEKVRNRGRA